MDMRVMNKQKHEVNLKSEQYAILCSNIKITFSRSILPRIYIIPSYIGSLLIYDIIYVITMVFSGFFNGIKLHTATPLPSR